MVDTIAIAGLALIGILIGSLAFVVASGKAAGSQVGEVVSSCPSIQYARNESSSGNLGCQYGYPFLRSQGQGSTVGFQTLSGTSFLKLTTFLGAPNHQQVLPQLVFTPITKFISNSKACTDITLTTNKMMGFKLNYTTRETGMVSLTLVFSLVTPAAGTTTYQLTYGTGNVPACNAAATGTLTGVGHAVTGAGTTITQVDQFSATLAANTAYWFDLTVSDTVITAITYESPELNVAETVNPLVGYWPFAEGTGTTTADLSGNAMTATFSTNHPSWYNDADCQISDCLNFVSSSSNQLTTAHNTVMDVSASASFTAWVYITTDSGGAMGIFGWNGVSGTAPMNIYINTGSLKLSADIHWSDATSTFYGSNIALTTAAWHFIAITYDGSNVRSYVDGVAGTVTAVVKTFKINAQGSSLGSYSGVANFWNGRLEELRAYDVSLTAAQIIQLQQYGKIYGNSATNTNAYGNVIEAFLPNQVNVSIRPSSVSWKAQWDINALARNQTFYPLGVEEAPGGGNSYADFTHIGSTGLWRCSMLGGIKTIASPPTVNTIHTFKITFVNSTGTDYFIDGTKVCSIAASITGLVSPFIELDNFGLLKVTANLWGFGGSV